MERKYVGNRVYAAEDGKYERMLERPQGMDAGTAGEGLAFFVGLLDRMMKDFFANVSALPDAYAALEKKYAGELSSLAL